MSFTDQDLLAAINHRNLKAAELLYDRYAETLHKVLYCTLKNKQQANKALPEVFNRIWDGIYEYNDNQGRLIIWMCGIAKKVAKNLLLEQVILQKVSVQSIENSSLDDVQFAV